MQPHLAELLGFSADIVVTDREHPLSLGGPHSSLGCHPAHVPKHYDARSQIGAVATVLPKEAAAAGHTPALLSWDPSTTATSTHRARRSEATCL